MRPSLYRRVEDLLLLLLLLLLRGFLFGLSSGRTRERTFFTTNSKFDQML